ncbi:MAG: hypothetical protein V7603_5126 [Micromonosporaceae bacterium]
MTAMPDLSKYSAIEDDAYEWFLSDHPWAVAERTRRRAASATAELEDAAKVRAWVDRTRAADAAGDLSDRPDGWRDSLVRLAESMGPVADENQLRTTLESAEPDDVWVAGLRRKLETRRRVAGDDAYVYPAHLIGPGAAAYPPPGEVSPQPGAPTK